MSQVGGIENGLPLGNQLGSEAIVNGGRGQQVEPGMVVLVVIPGEEVLAEAAGILNRAEAVRVLGPVLHGF